MDFFALLECDLAPSGQVLCHDTVRPQKLLDHCAAVLLNSSVRSVRLDYVQEVQHLQLVATDAPQDGSVRLSQNFDDSHSIGNELCLVELITADALLAPYKADQRLQRVKIVEVSMRLWSHEQRCKHLDDIAHYRYLSKLWRHPLQVYYLEAPCKQRHKACVDE